MKIRIINKSKHELPRYSTNHSAGMDLRSNIDNEIILINLFTEKFVIEDDK